MDPDKQINSEIEPCAPAYVPQGRSPLGGWPGGKYFLCKRIIARIPPHKCYCEPFAGAAWVLFKKSRSPVECVNDINDDVFNFYETVRTRADELMARAKWVLHSRKQQQVFWSEPMPSWEEDPIERAFRFYYLQRVSFKNAPRSGDRTCRTFISAAEPHRKYSREYFNEIINFGRERLERVIIEHLDWRKLIDIYDKPQTFFYMDPPYPFTSIDYGRPWTLADYQELADRLKTLKAKFLLSINDRPECREIFAGFNTESLQTTWAIGQKKSGELLISNYEYGQGSL